MPWSGKRTISAAGSSRARRPQKTFPFRIVFGDNGSRPMPQFRIHRLKDHLRANFRFAPHLSGTASVRPRDYETSEDAVVEATTPYAAFFALREAVQPIQV